MNVLTRQEQLTVLNMLVEGCSLRSITRLTGIHRTTVMNLMVRVGEACERMMNRWMKNLTLRHIQIDETWTFVAKKQGRIRIGEDSSEIGDVYFFYGIDEDTKLIPAYTVGKRNKETTDLFIQDLKSRLVLPDPFGDGNERKPQLSTDGWAAYPDSIEMAFAGSVSHGVLIKDYRNTDMPGRYGPPEMVGATRNVISGDIDEFQICTSHIERQNLSVRTFMRRFTRLALGFSKKLRNLEAAVSLFVAHHNFCRWHGSLKKTPAMAAQISGHPWTMEELLTEAESE